MKIDSTDASNVLFTKVQGPREPKPDTKDSKGISQNANTDINAVIDNKSLSQITDYEKRELPIAERVVIDAIEKANKAISGGNRRFEFSIHEKTKQIMIKVIDSDTNEVIREIPPEKTLDMVARLWEMAGIIVDERR
ncbi:MAG: flagellar protein FlaG [Clostridiales bacterium]|jgi:flagellar protein FlaG|nr:flagellar protein FlaG [Eubacteriales bacterium]MDH7566153.1 flagellar protein FlaG [Clostridiales bacterium]